MGLRKPYLVQRCNLSDDNLVYEYMGKAEFEIGDQARSLKRIFAKGITTGSITVNVDEKEVKFFLVAGEGFPFEQYKDFLMELANEDWHIPEPTRLKDVIKIRLGQITDEKEIDYHKDINAWFDFADNDVLFVLSEEELGNLVNVLNGIDKKWQEKAKSENTS